MSAEQTPSPPAPADIGLRCPHCEYNLTGLSDNRCPECGEAFDPATLQSRLQGEPAPVPGWDDGLQAMPLAFVATCLRTYFVPWRFGRSFPKCYRKRSARVFRWTAFLVPALPISCLSTHLGIEIAIGLLAAIFVGMNVCEWLAALFCAAAGHHDGHLAPAPAPQGSVAAYGLVGYFRSYLVVSFALLALLPRVATGRLRVAFLPLATFMVLWWALALWSAAAHRVKPGVRRIIILPLVICAGVLGAFCGYVSGVLVGMAIFDALR